MTQTQTRAIGRANRVMAQQVARIFVRHRHVRAVLLFGSLARGQVVGNDIDLILITDEERGSDFIALAEAAYQNQDREETLFRPLRNGIYRRKLLRLEAAGDALGEDFWSLVLEARVVVGTVELDVFVFPPDWQEHLNVLQKALTHSDPNFMTNIAREAVPIAF